MKAIVYHRYGSPDVLEFEEIEKPSPGDDEVLIKVHAASVNPADWHFIRGTPSPIRIMTGLRKPKNKRLGIDVAGQVEAVGRKVTQFKPGDEVFGASRGSFAEYVCTSESAVVRKPANVTFDQAGSVNVAAMTALQALRDKGKVFPGQKILINGAAGGVGTFAVQIAKSFSAEVTGVCSTRNLDMVRSIGAGRVIDYTQENFTRGGPRYDVILDCVGNHSFAECRRALTPQGTHIGIGGPGGPWLGPLIVLIGALLSSMFRSQKLVMMLARTSKQDLSLIGQLMETGKVTPVIDRRYKLHQVPDAIRYLEEGHARGKVVITIP